METTLSISPRPSPSLSPPPTTNPRRTHHLRRRRNARDQAQFPMPLIDLTLRRITTANPLQFRFHHQSNPLSLNSHIITSIRPKIMADEPKKADIQPRNAETTTLSDVGRSKDEEKGSEKSTAQPIPPPPTPPEKPLPGDCCGSGCVRCVWDVYYEELEEYNRLYKAN